MSNSTPFSDDLMLLLMQYAPLVPLFLVWLVGSVLCIVRWRRHPTVSLLSLLAFALFFLVTLVGPSLWFWGTRQGQERGRSSSEIGLYISIVAGIRSLASTAAWVMLLVALFGWRRPPGRVLGHDGEYLPEGFFATGRSESEGHP